MGSNILSGSLSAAVGAGVQNVQFVPTVSDVTRRVAIIGTHLASVTDLAAAVLFLSTSAAYTASKAGFGSMLHRLHLAFEKGSYGQVEVWVIPQAESGTAVVAVGEIDFAGSTGVLAGTLALYFGNHRVAVGITAAMSIEDITDACVAAINADADCPVSAAKHAVTFELDITAKSKGPWGNDISISLNNTYGDVTPTGITAAITPMASGANLPDITAALNAMGVDDGANEKFFTAIVHGYGQDTTTLDAISTYNGIGTELVGCYSELVARPFRSLVGDVVAGSSGLTALVALGGNRKDDRTSGIIAAPDSYSIPHELAAQAVGVAERLAADAAGRGYTDRILVGADPGDVGSRWTDNYSSGTDIAAKAGIGSTYADGSVLKIRDVLTFFHPSSVPVTSNGWREFCNIPKLQNILNSIKVTFHAEKFSGAIIVSDVAKVSDSVTRQYVIDINTVRSTLVALALQWERKAWIFQAAFTIKNLSVTLRDANDGFNTNIPLILSGMGKIFDNTAQFDISPAIILAA